MNYLLILFVLILIWRAADGYKAGMAKELQSFVTLVVTAISVAVICRGVFAYREGDRLTVFLSILFLVILGVLYKILGIVFFSAKAIAKLPVIHFVDKIMGIVMGVAEVIVLLWALYYVMDTFTLGKFSLLIHTYINQNEILLYLYENNWLKSLIGQLLEQVKIPDTEFIDAIITDKIV